MSPFAIPSFFDPEPLIKKLTVIGIIGNTQGVKTPPSPAAKAMRRNISNPWLLSVAAGTSVEGTVVSPAT